MPPHRALHFPVAFPPGGKPCSQHVRRSPPVGVLRLVVAGSPPPLAAEAVSSVGCEGPTGRGPAEQASLFLLPSWDCHCFLHRTDVRSSLLSLKVLKQIKCLAPQVATVEGTLSSL